MPWAADEPRWAAVAVWGEPRRSVLSAVVKEALRKHEIAADDSFKAELTTRLVGKVSRACRAVFTLCRCQLLLPQAICGSFIDTYGRRKVMKRMLTMSVLAMVAISGSATAGR